jgi:hypothetical protein
LDAVNGAFDHAFNCPFVQLHGERGDSARKKKIAPRRGKNKEPVSISRDGLKFAFAEAGQIGRAEKVNEKARV